MKSLLQSSLARFFAQFSRQRGLRRAASRSIPAQLQRLENRQLLSGTTITVTSLADTSQAGSTTLRDAITQANLETGDTIKFASSLAGGAIILTQGELPITSSMTIVGLGADKLAISGNAASRIFDAEDGTSTQQVVNISGLTLTAGDGLGTNSSGFGGAIYNHEALTLNGVVVSNNTGASDGGGIYSDGPLAIFNSTISGNSTQASGAGGGIDSNDVLTLVNTTVVNNTAATGGGIEVAATAKLTTVNATIAGNSATTAAGGVDNNTTWYSLNTIIAGNTVVTSSTVASDVVSAGSFLAQNSLVGDANSAGGLTGGFYGNIVGAKTTALFATNANGQPLLANNGGSTPTVAVLAGSPANGKGTLLSYVAMSLTATSGYMTVTDPTYLMVGQSVRIDSEVVTIAAISGQTVTIQRGRAGTTAAAHPNYPGIYLAFDQRGTTRSAIDMGATANNQPTVLAGTSLLTYALSQAAAAINPTITVTDTDSATLAFATVKLTNFYQRDDVLALVADSTTMGNITGVFSTTTGVLTLTSAGATATVAQFQAALRAVTYFNRSGATANVNARYVSYQVTDGIIASNVTTSTIGIGSFPVLGGGGALAYSTNQKVGVAITPTLTLTDTDHPNPVSATVKLTNFYQRDDVLAFVNTDATLFGNITGGFSTTSGILTLTSVGNTATVAQFQAALRAVTYFNRNGVNANGAQRTVQYVVSNGALTSNALASTISFGNASALAGAGTLNYSKSQTVGSAISPGLTLNDATHPHPASATVKLTNFYQRDDVLAFVNTDATLFGNITGGFSTTSGILTLTSVGNTATVAQYQAALRAVTYYNRNGIYANTANRYAQYQVSNGSLLSNTITSTIKIS